MTEYDNEMDRVADKIVAGIARIILDMIKEHDLGKPGIVSALERWVNSDA